jgi:hypothetical protein
MLIRVHVYCEKKNVWKRHFLTQKKGEREKGSRRKLTILAINKWSLNFGQR